MLVVIDIFQLVTIVYQAVRNTDHIMGIYRRPAIFI